MQTMRPLQEFMIIWSKNALKIQFLYELLRIEKINLNTRICIYLEEYGEWDSV